MTSSFSGSLGRLRDSASHIWMGGASSAARCWSISARFSPACWRPVKNNAMCLPVRRRYDPAGEHSRVLRRIVFRMDILMARIPAQRQHGHGRVVVVQYFALRRVANQLHHRRLDRGGRFRDDLALRRGRQRNAQTLLQAFPIDSTETHSRNVAARSCSPSSRRTSPRPRLRGPPP